MMGTSQEDIRGWLERAKEKRATHLIVVCDTFDHDDYPVFVMPGEDVHARVAHYSGNNMQTVMEVYAMHLDLEAQLRERRAHHLEYPPAKGFLEESGPKRKKSKVAKHSSPRGPTGGIGFVAPPRAPTRAEMEPLSELVRVYVGCHLQYAREALCSRTVDRIDSRSGRMAVIRDADELRTALLRAVHEVELVLQAVHDDLEASNKESER